MVEVLGQSLSLLLFSAGIVIAIMEALAPGAHLIVLGVALMAAGLIGLLVPSLASPLVLALLVTITGGAALVVYRRLNLYQGTDTGQTRSSDDLRGERGHVVERVTERSGRVKLERGGFDSTYAARSLEGEIPVDAEIVVIDPGGGNVITVEQLSEIDEIDRELAQQREREESEQA
ncbi:MAG: NfeD family protein [Halobacteriota archaeon]